MKGAGKAFTLSTSILQAYVARRLECLKQTLVITLDCYRGLRGDLYISGVEAVCQASEGASLEVPSRLPEGLEHMTRMMDRCA